ncbi:MAG: aminotransferase class I/II-fold pyridoxal phosphate-dependent enzyme [Coriobacteriales bacterium]|nr:aminotransferase class I/II-fold pyridoxal phosphate-dependent enzyme [Coriobacteriales bacterium]
MQAIILAAGMGKRLKELTKNNTKCMVKVNGVTLIDRMLHQIENQHLSRIVIVVGYEGQKLIDYINTLDIKTPIVYIKNPIYEKTNNIYSLALAKEFLCQEDTLLFESDLIFEDAVLETLVNDPRDTLALVDKYESWMDGTCVKLSEDDCIEAFVPGKHFKFNEISEYYKTVNIYKFSKHFSKNYYVPFLDAYQEALGENEYYEQVLRVITMLDEPVIKAKRLEGQRWYEIDDIQDLDIAESIFTPDEDERVRLLQSRFGGYWRYPKLLDFCYLVNPYFPPKKLKDELKSIFDILLTEYPSGMRVNSLLAAKNFSVHQENILVGNGAAELIKSLLSHLSGKVGFIRPTFEEYPNRYDRENSVDFIPDNWDYSYTVDDVIEYFEDKDINNLILINPDNPSGNYIPKAGLCRLIDWAQHKNIKLIVDESFADFSDELDNTLITQDVLSANPHLYVMKSISKSYGVPGLRLGVLASGDTETIAKMKKDVAIWNINSFAEFYMQIEEKYKKDYVVALEKVRAERKRFQAELAKITGVRVIPSQANFIMIELEEGISPKDLLKRLMIKHNILVKELATKTNGRNYLRIAVRNTADNNALMEAMKAELMQLCKPRNP